MELAKPLSLYPFETIIPPVNDEAFNLYYAIDRELYTRLIHNLARDPIDSMHVMALWIWLEKKWKNTNLINEILSLPLEVLNVLADESMLCLRCIESNTYPPAVGELHQTEITLIPEVVNRGPLLNLRYFHENRLEVSTGVTKFITTVCMRAFKDIVQNHIMRQQMMSNNSAVMSGGRYESGVSSKAEEMMMRNSMTIINNNTYNKMVNSGDDVHYYNPAGAVGGVVNVPVMYLPNNYHGSMVRPPFVPVVPTPEGRATMNNVHEDLPLEAYGDLLPSSFVQMMLADDLSEVFGKNLTVNNNWEGENAGEGDGGDEEEVAPDDRTIFLTFSKGYPTSKDEVREFFTRKFGNFIEDLIMQEVEADEQPLYARMVCRSLSVIPSIVGPNKAKYNINGKHVWARKYVTKQNSRV